MVKKVFREDGAVMLDHPYHATSPFNMTHAYWPVRDALKVHEGLTEDERAALATGEWFGNEFGNWWLFYGHFNEGFTPSDKAKKIIKDLCKGYTFTAVHNHFLYLMENEGVMHADELGFDIRLTSRDLGWMNLLANVRVRGAEVTGRQVTIPGLLKPVTHRGIEAPTATVPVTVPVRKYVRHADDRLALNDYVSAMHAVWLVMMQEVENETLLVDWRDPKYWTYTESTAGDTSPIREGA